MSAPLNRRGFLGLLAGLPLLCQGLGGSQAKLEPAKPDPVRAAFFGPTGEPEIVFPPINPFRAPTLPDGHISLTHARWISIAPEDLA